MKSHKKFTILALAGLIVVGMSTFMVVKAFACEEGCTPGFWKNPKHFCYWIGYSPGDNVGAIFGSWDSDYDFLKGQTLLQALQKKGGGGGYLPHQKAARILLRQAVASLLSGAYLGWEKHYVPSTVIGMVNAVLQGNDASLIEEVKNIFRDGNEMGSPICE